jgi:hypothetical protein
VYVVLEPEDELARSTAKREFSVSGNRTRTKATRLYQGMEALLAATDAHRAAGVGLVEERENGTERFRAEVSCWAWLGWAEA